MKFIGTVKFPFGKWRLPIWSLSLLVCIWVFNVLTPLFDFRVFWTAALLADQGQGLKVYDHQVIQQMIRQVSPQYHWLFGWFYPPTFLILLMLFGRLSLNLSYTLFVGGSVFGLLFSLYRYSGWEGVFWGGLSAATLLNVMTGQNAALTALLAFLALLNLEKRPVLAGVFIGFLTIKPQLCLLFPVALIAGRHWRTLTSAVVTGGLLMALSLAILGIDIATAWVSALAFSRFTFENLSSAWILMPTIFSLLRQTGVPVALAYDVQFSLLILAMWMVWRVWKKDSVASKEVRYATLIGATMLGTPYLYYYDLTWLAISMLWLMNAKGITWRGYERVLLGVVWLQPALIGAHFLHGLPIPQITPLVVLLYAMILGRCASVRSNQAHSRLST